MTDDPRDADLAAELRRAYPAPAPGDVVRAWSAVAASRRLAPRRAPVPARAAAALVLLGASFAAGYAAGRGGAGSAAARSSSYEFLSDSIGVPIRPPELVPATAVGGAS